MSKYSEKEFKDKKIIYIDMDNTLFDFNGAYKSVKDADKNIEYPQSQEGFFKSLKPLNDSIRVVKRLIQDHRFFVLFLTAPSVKNPLSYTEKRLSIEIFFGIEMCERLIISGYKGLNKGDYLIDDYSYGKGQEYFEGKLLHFGVDFKDWKAIENYFFGEL